MEYRSKISTEELLLSNGLTAFIRTRMEASGIGRIDLSLYKYKNEAENPEVRVYTRRVRRLITTADFADIYKILSDEDKCYKLWKENKKYEEEQNQ